MQYRSGFEACSGDRCRNLVCIGSPARSAAYYANLRDCAPSNEGGVLSRLSRWWRLRISRPSLSRFAAWARPNLKSPAGVLYGFRFNKNARGQSSPELNSRNERLWKAEVQVIFVKPSKLPMDLKVSLAPPKFANVSAVGPADR